MFFVFMKLLELFNFCIFDVCLFLLSGQNSMIFDYFYEVGKILSIFEYFHVVGKFHNFWLLSWSRHKFFCCFHDIGKKIFTIFTMLPKFHDFWVFLWSRQNFIIFGCFHVNGKISWFLAVFIKLAIALMKLRKFLDFQLFLPSW